MVIRIIIPTIITTLCATIGVICISRIMSVKNKLENFLAFMMCLSVAVWSYSGYLYSISWMLGKLAGLLLVVSMLSYANEIMGNRHKRASSIVLWTSALMLVGLLFVPGMNLVTYSAIFSIVVYSQVLVTDVMLYRYYIKHHTSFYLIVAILGSFMIVFGIFETCRPVLRLIEISATPIASMAFVGVAWFLVIERGYFNTKTWTDYVIELVQKEKLLEEKYYLLKNANINSIIILTQTIEAKDPYTRGHCLRVRNYSKAIGEALGLNKESLSYLEYGALLHDIGKILIPGRILNKNGSLTEEEFSIIKRHSEIGENILKNVDYFEPVLPMIRHHHESFNGEGYPDGLRGESIPLEARILAVCDTFDALTSDRPYRGSMGTEKAIDILNQVSGAQLDAGIVDVFISNRIYSITHSINDKLFIDQ